MKNQSSVIVEDSLSKDATENVEKDAVSNGAVSSIQSKTLTKLLKV